MKLDFYEVADISQILKNNCETLELPLPENILSEVAKKSRGTPRIANRLLKILRDYHTIGKNITDISELRTIFSDIGIDQQGLDYLDRKYLEAMYKNFNGGPVGLGTLASVL